MALAVQLVIVAVAIAQVQHANRERNTARAQRAGFEQELADVDAEMGSIRESLDEANRAADSSQEQLDDSAKEIRTLERRISDLKEALAKARAAAAPKPSPTQSGGGANLSGRAYLLHDYFNRLLQRGCHLHQQEWRDFPGDRSRAAVVPGSGRQRLQHRLPLRVGTAIWERDGDLHYLGWAECLCEGDFDRSVLDLHCIRLASLAC